MSIGDEVVKSAEATSTETLVTGAGRLRAVALRGTTTAGTAEFRDGGGEGTTMLTLYTPAVAEGSTVQHHGIPGLGIPYATDLYCVLTNVGAVTVFYAEDRHL